MIRVENQVKEQMKQVVEHLHKELKSLRTSRANPSMVENITVEVYGTQMKVRDLANITTPEARQILITPYDASVTNTVAKEIENSDLGFRPAVEGNLIRIHIPPMDEETRKKIEKECYKRGEEAKIAVRSVRRDSNELVRKQKNEGEITEDELKASEKTIQNLTDQYCKEVDQICQKKAEEILAV